MSDRSDARAYWAALSPQDQQRLGEAAMIWFFSMVAETVRDQLSDVARQRWQHEEWLRPTAPIAWDAIDEGLVIGRCSGRIVILRGLLLPEGLPPRDEADGTS